MGEGETGDFKREVLWGPLENCRRYDLVSEAEIVARRDGKPSAIVHSVQLRNEVGCVLPLSEYY